MTFTIAIGNKHNSIHPEAYLWRINKKHHYELIPKLTAKYLENTSNVVCKYYTVCAKFKQCSVLKTV